MADGYNAYVPTVVIAESTTGTARDARINRVLKGCSIIVLSEAIARDAGALRAQVRDAGTVDATVIASADRIAGSIVLTSDPNDLLRLVSVRNRSKIVSI